MNRVELALACFQSGFSCAQSILSTYGTELGLEREQALRAAGAFGGGMGRLGRTCGAVTGAFMVIGLKYGRTRAEDSQAAERTYTTVRDFVDRFQARRGSIECRELLGCDISRPEGLSFARENRLFGSVCPGIVRDAAEVLEDLFFRATG
jgi:C_GCAxxG_C_C family probable redox protein